VTDLRWIFARMPDLGVESLYDWLALRARVFSVEQQCAYLDPDGADRQAWHLLGRDGAGRLLAGLRLVDPGVKYVEPSIGRVVTAPEARGTGLGRRLLAEGLARADATWPGRGNRISAQSHLAPFYAGFGYAAQGDDYLEDGIPHLEMLRRPGGLVVPPSLQEPSR
jgi:ElaA protein